MKFREEIGADTIIEDYDPPEVSNTLEHYNSIYKLLILYIYTNTDVCMCTYICIYVGAKGMFSWWSIWGGP